MTVNQLSVLDPPPLSSCIKRMTRTPNIVLLVLGVYLGGCTTNPSAHPSDRLTWLDESRAYVPLEPRRDGQILVYVSGDAQQRGPHWVPEDANILTLEEVAGAGNEGAITLEPKFVVVHREVDGRTLEMRYDLHRRTRPEKEAIHLRHGDRVTFPRTNCW